jgi:nitrate reductase delta subunit
MGRGGRRDGRPDAQRTAYMLCSLLLQYPDEELLAGRDELAAAASALRSPGAERLRRFVAWWAATPPLDLERHYVQVFDLTRRCGLYLTYYALGDRRERGQALVRLRVLYRECGLPQEGAELPDYLPVVLEFAAHAPGREGEKVLRENRAALELIRLGLHEEESPYADVLDALGEMLGAPAASDRARAMRLAAEGPPQELVGLEPFAPPEVMPGEAIR